MSALVAALMIGTAVAVLAGVQYALTVSASRAPHAVRSRTVVAWTALAIGVASVAAIFYALVVLFQTVYRAV